MMTTMCVPVVLILVASAVSAMHPTYYNPGFMGHKHAPMGKPGHAPYFAHPPLHPGYIPKGKMMPPKKGMKSATPQIIIIDRESKMPKHKPIPPPMKGKYGGMQSMLHGGKLIGATGKVNGMVGNVIQDPVQNQQLQAMQGMISNLQSIVSQLAQISSQPVIQTAPQLTPSAGIPLTLPTQPILQNPLQLPSSTGILGSAQPIPANLPNFPPPPITSTGALGSLLSQQLALQSLQRLQVPRVQSPLTPLLRQAIQSTRQTGNLLLSTLLTASPTSLLTVNPTSQIRQNVQQIQTLLTLLENSLIQPISTQLSTFNSLLTTSTQQLTSQVPFLQQSSQALANSYLNQLNIVTLLLGQLQNSAGLGLTQSLGSPIGGMGTMLPNPAANEILQDIAELANPGLDLPGIGGLQGGAFTGAQSPINQLINALTQQNPIGTQGQLAQFSPLSGLGGQPGFQQQTGQSLLTGQQSPSGLQGIVSFPNPQLGQSSGMTLQPGIPLDAQLDILEARQAGQMVPAGQVGLGAAGEQLV